MEIKEIIESQKPKFFYLDTRTFGKLSACIREN